MFFLNSIFQFLKVLSDVIPLLLFRHWGAHHLDGRAVGPEGLYAARGVGRGQDHVIPASRD